MIYALRLYELEVTSPRVFSAVFDKDGRWPMITRNLAGHIHADLLRHSTHARVFLSIKFWTSEQSYTLAQNSDEVLVLNRCLRTLTVNRHDLGLFSFSHQAEERLNDEQISSQIRSDCLQGGTLQ